MWRLKSVEAAFDMQASRSTKFRPPSFAVAPLYIHVHGLLIEHPYIAIISAEWQLYQLYSCHCKIIISDLQSYSEADTGG